MQKICTRGQMQSSTGCNILHRIYLSRPRIATVNNADCFAQMRVVGPLKFSNTHRNFSSAEIDLAPANNAPAIVGFVLNASNCLIITTENNTRIVRFLPSLNN